MAHRATGGDRTSRDDVDALRRARATGVVRWVLAASIVSTIGHYAHNLVHVDDYPQPDWVNHAVIPVAWVLLTAVGLAGYALFRRGRYASAAACFLVYSYTGVSSLGHYAYGGMSEFTAAMHVGIILDGVTGAAVLALAVWTFALGARGRVSEGAR
jgi:hypothetical protein